MTDEQVYVVLIEDRHADVEVHVFRTADAAVAYAEFMWNANIDDDGRLNPDLDMMTPDELQRAGWLFYRCYSVEGDCVRAMPVAVDD